MFENPRRGRQARNFTTNVPKILDLYFFAYCLYNCFVIMKKRSKQACTTFISLNIRMLVHFLSSLAGVYRGDVKNITCSSHRQPKLIMRVE